MSDRFKPRPLMLDQIEKKLKELDLDGLTVSGTAVHLAEIFYDFWKGEGLLREYLDANSTEKLTNVLLELQIRLQHLEGHISVVKSEINKITGLQREKRSTLKRSLKR